MRQAVLPLLCPVVFVGWLFIGFFLLPPHGIMAQPYEERLRFLYQKSEELEKIKIKARVEQIALRASRTEHDQSTINKWKQLEAESRKTLKRVETIIRQLEARMFRSVIEKYRAQDTRILHIDKTITLKRLDGRRDRMQAFQGRVVLLHFWATWCKPCLSEIPSLKTFYDRFDSDNFEILAISLDARQKDIDRFVRGRGIRFPIYFDPGRAVYQQVVGGLEVLPHSILLDKEGNVFKSYVGEQRWESPTILEDVGMLLSAK